MLRLHAGSPNLAHMQLPLHPLHQPRDSNTRTANVRANTHATAAHITRAICVRVPCDFWRAMLICLYRRKA